MLACAPKPLLSFANFQLRSTMPFNLLQQDPAGWTPLANHTLIGINTSGQVAIKQPDGSVQIFTSSTPSQSNQSNSSGTTSVVPTQPLHTAQVVLDGTTTRTAVIALDTTSPVIGGIIRLTALFVSYAAIAGLTIEVRDTDAGGTLLASYTTGGDNIVSAYWEFVYRDGQWNITNANIPAY